MKSWHTFAICAYKESPYLEDCIRSIKKQAVSSEVILVTSTSCDYIKNLCIRYAIPYYINNGEIGITQDWNFAYQRADTPVVTIAHQDDIYFREYTRQMKKMFQYAKMPLIFFSNYYEIRNDKIVKNNLLLNIKRLMLLPLQMKCLQHSIFVRRRILSFGSPICCPSVAFFKPNLPETVFSNHFRTNEDWEAWEMLSRRQGQFLYCKKPLVAHRIHRDSETMAAIQDGGRSKEDIEMYRKFWCGGVAVLLSKCYKKSEDINRI